MKNKKELLINLQPGESGLVTGILGGINFHKKLESLGIRKGVVVKKLTAQFGRGPITIQVGRTQVGLGYGMAQKIEVERVEE